MHQHILSGRLGRQPELRVTDTTGALVCNLAVAHDSWTKDADDQWVKVRTQWYDVTVWGELAERCSEYAKGTKLIVNLRDDLKPRLFRRGDGTMSAALQVTANTVEAVQTPSRPDTEPASTGPADPADPALDPHEQFELEPAA
jgi:single-strand DNA-binding protein